MCSKCIDCFNFDINGNLNEVVVGNKLVVYFFFFFAKHKIGRYTVVQML